MYLISEHGRLHLHVHVGVSVEQVISTYFPSSHIYLALGLCPGVIIAIGLLCVYNI